MDKLCYSCGKKENVLISDDAEYYRRCRENFIKPPEMPEKFNTPIKYGCPYDCGLCPGHEQHSCVTVVEITDHCNLQCPICYAGSGPQRKQDYRTYEHVIQMLDAVVENEGEPDVVQISGGEPTLHPDFFRILDACKERPIRHLMVNTNGLVIANDAEFVEKLAGYKPGFEVYLQFDSFEKNALMELRGADLRKSKEKAIQALNKHNISTTLVMTVKKGLNDHEIGKVVEYALTIPCIRGVTLQPIQDAGRVENYDSSLDRLTLSEVRRNVYEQNSVFTEKDILPVPCHPDSIAMAYAIKTDEGVIPISGLIDDETLVQGPRNTIQLEHDPIIKEKLFNLLSTAHSPKSASHSLNELLCCLPSVQSMLNFTYDNVFRIIIMDFIDAHSFDLRSIKKTCVHIVSPDLRIIPFDTFNMFYRGDLEDKVLGPIRKELELAGMALVPDDKKSKKNVKKLPMVEGGTGFGV